MTRPTHRFWRLFGAALGVALAFLVVGVQAQALVNVVEHAMGEDHDHHGGAAALMLADHDHHDTAPAGGEDDDATDGPVGHPTHHHHADGAGVFTLAAQPVEAPRRIDDARPVVWTAAAPPDWAPTGLERPPKGLAI